jgi:hypothetical protein
LRPDEIPLIRNARLLQLTAAGVDWVPTRDLPRELLIAANRITRGVRLFGMGAITRIAWCDATFNPWVGCLRVSTACDRCYAAALRVARRQGAVVRAR